MDPEQLALLRRISDEPDDDAPRLVYADWLEEHGAAGAAGFVRAHLGLERACVEGLEEKDFFGSSLAAVRVREEVSRPLLAPFGELGLTPGHQETGPPDEMALFYFRRGLPEGLAVRGPRSNRIVGERAGELFVRGPLRRLALRSCGWLAEHRTVHAQVLRSLLACPEARRLRSLDLRGCDHSRSILVSLLSSPHLPSDTVIGLPERTPDRTDEKTMNALRERYPNVRFGFAPFDPNDPYDVPF